MRTHRTFRLLASLLLMLGILAGSDLTSLHAQKTGPKEEKKAFDKAPEPPNPKEGPPPSVQSPPQVQVGFESAQSGLVSFSSRSLQFNIDPKTPLKALLPTPPKSRQSAGPVLGNDLSRVPEVRFEAPSNVTNNEALRRIAHQMAKINHLNGKKTDGFIEALRSERPDLTGLPFAMGDACRTKGERSKQFSLAVATVRRALQSGAPMRGPMPGGPGMPGMRPPGARAKGFGNRFETLNSPGGLVSAGAGDSPSPETFWDQYQDLCNKEDKTQNHLRREQREMVTLARIAALSQILMPMAEMHPGFVKYLAAVSHVEATRALARFAIFSGDDEVRRAAVDALKVRRERDYTDVLVSGLRYPWPAVARRAAKAIAKLERKDLLPQLVDLLEQDDPRTPVMRKVKDKEVPVVRELVRVNHHRSCLLCHAPGNTGKVSADAVTAGVPVPGQPLNPPTGPYNNSQPEILVRVDVTYLRQDFSALQPVADANPWPEMQRFDFLVRERVLTEEEAISYRDKLKPHEEGEFSPYQRAALAALRDMTGRDTEPTPQAWRRLLKKIN
jgi:hypothetical protein